MSISNVKGFQTKGAYRLSLLQTTLLDMDLINLDNINFDVHVCRLYDDNTYIRIKCLQY